MISAIGYNDLVTVMILYFAFFNFAVRPFWNSALPNFNFRNFNFRIGTLFEHDRAPYRSKKYDTKTELNFKSFSIILDGSQHRFIVLNDRL